MWFFRFIVILCLVALSTPANAEKRTALVIGNSAYTKVPILANPGHDASAMAATLRRVGFDVVQQHDNAGGQAMRRALRDFADQARDADIAVVFYAGHGIEVNGVNYLLPVDAVLERDTDAEDEAVSLDRILQMLASVKRLRLVILDACRDNPFSPTMRRTVATRSIGRGLAKVDVIASDTLVAFAAKAGSTAADGDGNNSPFTSALVKHLIAPGLDVRLALGRVRDDVLKATANRQEPFVYGSLGGAELPIVTAKTPSQLVDGCRPGLVQRGANDDDKVCVTAEEWTEVRQQNVNGANNFKPGGGDYGPHTCRMGYVWREAFVGDFVCVTPYERDQAWRQTRQARDRSR